MHVRKKLTVNGICFILAGLLMLLFFGIRAFASRGEALFNSRGNFSYSDGTGEVYLCADDFYAISSSLAESDRLLNAKFLS